MSAADPLTRIGILTPGARVLPTVSNRILFWHGEPIAIKEAGEVRFLVELPPAEAWRAKTALLRRPDPERLREGDPRARPA